MQGKFPGRAFARLLPAAIVMAATLGTLPPPAVADSGLPPYYHARGQDSWDFWYVRHAGTYYCYYLQSPVDLPVRFTYPTIGLASSTDLVHWRESGEVLRANPAGDWNDSWVATGSTWWNRDRWSMLFTAVTGGSNLSVGMAESDDLVHWTRAGQGPVTLNNTTFIVPESRYWQALGHPAGQAINYDPVADPYVLPEPIDGWYYMVMDARVRGQLPTRYGAVALFKSRDGRVWDAGGLIAFPGDVFEMEAPQVWRHGDRWYMVFGSAQMQASGRATRVFSAPALEGPFEPVPRDTLKLPDWRNWFYVAKVIPGPQGQDVLMGCVGGILSRPYPVSYEPDGSITLARSETASAQWAPGGLATYGGSLVSDLSGGVIAGGAYRIDASGYAVWGPAAALPGATWAGDGIGGAVGVSNGAAALLASRVSPLGALTWGSSVPVCAGTQPRSNAVVTGDGMGGAFVAWLDARGGGPELYAQHLNADGQPAWAENGVVVCAAPAVPRSPAIARDAGGGIYLAWRDDRDDAVGGADLYAQHLDASGTPAWAANGIPACAATGIQESPVLVSDATGGAYLAWWDSRGGGRDLFLQRLVPGGLASWPLDGVGVATAPQDQVFHALAADRTGGVIAAWEDRRAGNIEGLDIYAQRVDSTGAAAWPQNGVPVCLDRSAQARPAIVPDGAGGAVIAWMDARDYRSPQLLYTTYAQRIDAGGTPLWAPDGVRLERAPGAVTPVAPSMAADGSGGAFVSGVSGLQRVLPDGRLAWMPTFSPTVERVEDAPADEGGAVRVTFRMPLAVSLGLAPAISSYELWRQSSPDGPANPPDGWELLMSFAPPPGPTAALTAATRADSNRTGTHEARFSIVARTTDPELFLPSVGVLGHSVDNLAPIPPTGLAGAYRPGAGALLSWTPGPERDLAGYAVYRGTSDAFATADSNRIGSTEVATFFDPAYDPARTVYKVTALDRHGNESPAATISANQIGTRPVPVPPMNALESPTPNPTASTTTIAWSVAAAGHASLVVYDLAGRRERTLVEGIVSAGPGVAHWDARDAGGRPSRPGIYLVRFVSPGFERTRRLVLLP